MFKDESSAAAKARKKRDAAKLAREKAQALRKKKETFIRAEEEKKRLAEQTSSSTLPPIENSGGDDEKPSPILPTALTKNIINSINLPNPPQFPKSSQSSQKTSAADAAAQQRLQRKQQQKLLRGTTALQAIIRKNLSNSKYFNDLSKDFDSKILTIAKLIKVLSLSPSKSADSYKVPPATASQMVTQFLIISGNNPSHDLTNLTRLCEFTLNNGVSTDSNNSLHPIMSWLQHSNGRRRLKVLIFKCVEILPLVKNAESPIIVFLNSILSTSNEENSQLAAFCLNAIFNYSQLLTKLRNHLMTIKISNDEDAVRPTNEFRTNFSLVFFDFVFDLVKNNNSSEYLLAFTTNVLSVPLLSNLLSDSHLNTLSLLLPLFCKSIMDQLTSMDSIPLSILLPSYSLTTTPVPTSLALFSNIVFFVRTKTSGAIDSIFTIPLLGILLNEMPLGT